MCIRSSGRGVTLRARLLGLCALLSVTHAQENPVLATTFPLETDISCADANDQPRSNFRVTLTQSQEDRAAALYRGSIIITAHDHCWTPADFVDQRKSGLTVRVIKPLTDGYYRKGAERFPITAEVAGWEERGKAALAILQNRAGSSQGKIRIVRTVDNILQVKHDQAAGVILSFEGGRPLAAKLENLATYYGLGPRALHEGNLAGATRGRCP